MLFKGVQPVTRVFSRKLEDNFVPDHYNIILSFQYSIHESWTKSNENSRYWILGIFGFCQVNFVFLRNDALVFFQKCGIN